MEGRLRDNLREMNWGCHGIPERCLVYKGKRMKICARCFGSNIGHIISVVLLIACLLPAWYYSLLFLGILLFDWSLQHFFQIMSNNVRRVITGVIGGIGVGSLLWGGIYFAAMAVKGYFA